MFQEMIRQIQRAETISYTGKIENIVGMSIEASGGRAAVGDICQIYNGDAGGQVMAEVVGFKNDHILLMPYSDMSGISAGNFVRNTGRRLSLRMGPFLKGRVINALGQPIDGKGPFQGGTLFCVENNHYINPMTRPPIRERMEFGVKAIDSMLTIGKGQRIGIFAGSGVGKSTLMGMIAKNVKADINVIALVGERGREVLEFMEKDLGPEGMRRSILVVATSDQPAMLRKQCPSVATGIAEYFRDQGCHVLLMMDSLTRFAMAQREIGLAVGEPSQTMYDIIDAVEPYMPQDKPRYLMGVGTPSNIIEGVARGVDFFDCVMPARNARHGKLFTWSGSINLKNEKYKLDEQPIDEQCDCPTCRNFSRAYLRHLFKAEEILALRLAVMHNLYFYNKLTQRIRDALDAGEFAAFRAEYSTKLSERV